MPYWDPKKIAPEKRGQILWVVGPVAGPSLSTIIDGTLSHLLGRVVHQQPVVGNGLVVIVQPMIAAVRLVLSLIQS